MGNFNIYFQNSNNGFWYDHGIELVSAIVTLLAFLFTFYNINRTNKKQDIEEQKKNEKTLKMFDLVTQKQSNRIEKCLNSFEESQKVEERENIQEHPYLITFSINNLTIATENKSAVILTRKINYLYNEDVEKDLKNYIEKLEEMLTNNHTNLNLYSLERVTNKLNDLNEVINQINQLKIHFVPDLVFRDLINPIEDQKKIQEKLSEVEQIKGIMKKASMKLSD